MSTTQNCSVCQGPAAKRGGRPLVTPGCCGAWLHQDCYDQLRQRGSAVCPNCRVSFPESANAQTPVTDHASWQTKPPSLFRRMLPSRATSIFSWSSRGNREAASNTATTSIVDQVSATNVPLQIPSRAAPSIRGMRNYRMSSLSSIDTDPDSYDPALLLEDNLVVVSTTTLVPKAIGKATACEEEEANCLVIRTTPERRSVGPDRYESFYVNVSLLSLMPSYAATGTTRSYSTSRQQGMDLVCVLDNSGSMDGSKLESVKQAMRFVTSQLTPQDRLSIVNFNSYARIQHGLLSMTEDKKLISEGLMLQLEADGGTDIYSGMKKGMCILDDRIEKNTLSCMFLLTDGQDDTHRDERQALAREMRYKGVALYVFGFGADHDSEQMEEIARAAEGSFIYVEKDDTVIDAFGGALGGQQGTTAKNITLTITCTERPPAVGAQPPVAVQPVGVGGGGDVATIFATLFGFGNRAAAAAAAGATDEERLAATTDTTTTPTANDHESLPPAAEVVVIQNTRAGNYTAIVSADRRSVEVSFASLFVGEQRDVLVELDVPAVRTQPGSAIGLEGIWYPLIDARATYSSLDGDIVHAVAAKPDDDGAAHGVEGGEAHAAGNDTDTGSESESKVAHCGIRRLSSNPDPKDKAGTRNLQVDAQINRFIASDALTQALELADQGDYSAAREVINDAIAAIESSVSNTNTTSDAATGNRDGDAAVRMKNAGYLEDLRDALEKTRDRNIYETMGGKAEMTEATTRHTYQRSTYTKTGKMSNYQTLSSATFQSTAAHSKMSYK